MQTLPHRMQGDATALFTMFRNVFGSVGISSSTAAIVTRTQAHMAYLSYHLTGPIRISMNSISQLARAIQGLGSTAAASTQKAVGQAYQTLIAQAGFLAYKDVFLYCAVLAFAFSPLTLLFSPLKKAAALTRSALMAPPDRIRCSLACSSLGMHGRPQLQAAA